jgi:transcription elongation factor Elf1
MRTLVCIKDVQDEANVPLRCPLCGLTDLPVVTCHLDISAKGTVIIQKGAECPVHGYFNTTKGIKAVQMYGRDAQVIPSH